MIELPTTVGAVDVKFTLLDFGAILRPSSGAPALRVNRAGSRYVLEVLLQDLRPDAARVVQARLQRAKREGLRMPYPLLGLSQGSPGSPVVDGTDSAGTTLKLKTLTPHYVAKEGYWLTVTDADGALYLHQVAATVAAGADGKATVSVTPPLRAVLADGSVVHLAKPLVEGIVTSEVSWSLPRDRIIPGLSFVIEEAA